MKKAATQPNPLWEQFTAWFHEHIWTADTLSQAVIVMLSFTLGRIFFRLIDEPVTKTIEESRLPIRLKRSFRNLERLIFPLFSIIFAFIIARMGEFLPNPPLDVTLVDAVLKVVGAWIVIRIALEFVANPLARNFFAVSIWTIAALSIFNILPQTMAAMDAIGFNLGNFRLSALGVVKGIFATVIFLYLALFASTFAERWVLKSKSLTRSSQVLVAKIIRIVLIGFALIIAVASAGIDLSIFAVLSGAIGLGIGFGLQKVASNLFSGMLLLMDKSIEPGDVIELEDSKTFGWVKTMGARYIEIITRDNKAYLIPNEDFVTQRVVNWSHGNDRLVRISVVFGVHYESDIHKVIEIARQAATKPARVVETPAPVCWITEFGDSGVNFTLRFWIKDAEAGVANVKGEVMLSLWEAFQENKIKIPYPQRVVHMVQN